MLLFFLFECNEIGKQVGYNAIKIFIKKTNHFVEKKVKNFLDGYFLDAYPRKVREIVITLLKIVIHIICILKNTNSHFHNCDFVDALQHTFPIGRLFYFIGHLNQNKSYSPLIPILLVLYSLAVFRVCYASKKM